MDNNLEIKYVCTGGCGGSVTQKEYDAGKTTCGTPSCSKFGHEFVKRQFCSVCREEVQEGEEHSHYR